MVTMICCLAISYPSPLWLIKEFMFNWFFSQLLQIDITHTIQFRADVQGFLFHFWIPRTNFCNIRVWKCAINHTFHTKFDENLIQYYRKIRHYMNLQNFKNKLWMKDSIFFQLFISENCCDCCVIFYNLNHNNNSTLLLCFYTYNGMHY